MPYCTYSLSGVIMELAVRAGMDPRNIDVSRLEQEVRGFTVINTYPCTEALRALSQIFLFDPSNYDAQVHFIPRGDNTIATITEDDMLDDQQEVQQVRRSDAIQIPRVLHLNYFDVDGGLSTEKQSSERSGDRRATGETSLQSAVLMNGDEAAQAVSINHKIMIEDQKGEIKFSLPDSWLQLVPASNVFVQAQGVTRRARIIKADTNDGYQEYVMLHDRQSAYVSAVEAFPGSPPSAPPSNVVGPTVIVPLDIHILRDSDDNQGLIFYLAISGLLGGWTGALIELSYDGGANYVDSGDVSTAAIIGEVITATLPDHPQEFPDVTHTCRIKLHTSDSELLPATLAEMQNGANLAIIGDELVQFGLCTEIDPVTQEWEIAYLLRGRKGSTTSSHVVGTRFVLLERSALTLIPLSLPDIGKTLTFRATSFGTSTDDGTVVSMLYTGRSQIEREVGYLAAHIDGSDALVTWQGIGRLGSGATVAQGARFAGYRVRFDDGITEETVDTLNQNLTHDVSGFVFPLTIGVVQLNDLTGAGPETEVIIT